MIVKESNACDPVVLTVVGTRPEAIKMAPVIDACREQSEIQSKLLFTGQHKSLVSQTMRTLDFDPDFNLNLMGENQTLYDIANKAMLKIRDIVQSLKPDCIMVQGDTATAFATSMVAFLEGIPLGHVEAGLRSHNDRDPFPEEGYRKLIDVLADFYFAPTQLSAQNLLHEGVSAQNIYVTGNTVVDALEKVVPVCSSIENHELAAIFERAPSKLILLTAHRRESFGKPLENIFSAIEKLTELEPELEIIYPVHPNPNVSESAERLVDNRRIHILKPLSYEDMLISFQKVQLILTDSGGIQEEAPSFGLHTLVMRNTTERQEGIDAGVATLVGTDTEEIIRTTLNRLKTHKAISTPIALTNNPYGDGKASGRIADILRHILVGVPRNTTDWEG